MPPPLPPHLASGAKEAPCAPPPLPDPRSRPVLVGAAAFAWGRCLSTHLPACTHTQMATIRAQRAAADAARESPQAHVWSTPVRPAAQHFPCCASIPRRGASSILAGFAPTKMSHQPGNVEERPPRGTSHGLPPPGDGYVPATWPLRPPLTLPAALQRRAPMPPPPPQKTAVHTGSVRSPSQAR